MKFKLILYFFILLCNNLIAQKSNIESKSEDKKFSKLGIYVGLGNQSYLIKETDWRLTNVKDTFNSIYSTKSINFNLGMQYQTKISKNIFFRQRFQLSFETSKYTFERKSSFIENIKKQNILIETPIHLLFQIDKQVKPYFFGGVTPKFSLGQDTGYQKIENYKNFDLEINYGIGIEIKLKKYSIAPEISFSNGILNSYNTNNSVYSSTISELKKQSINFTFIIKD